MSLPADSSGPNAGEKRPATRRNSRGRHLEFVRKFRAGEIGTGEDNEDSGQSHSDPPDGNGEAPKSGGKRPRKSYLRAYIHRLWPHWPLVLTLIVLAIAISGLEIIQPLFARYVFDDILLADLTSEQKFWRLHGVCGLFLAISLVTRAIGVLRSRWQELLNNRVILSLRHALYRHLLHLGLDRLADMKVGGIISRLTDDINRTTGTLQMAVISPGVALLRLVLAAIILFAINWRLALTTLAIIPPIMLVSMMAIRRVRPIYRAIRKDVSSVDGRVGEAFSGIRAVRAFGGEQRETREYVGGNNLITRKRMFANAREIIVWTTWAVLIGTTQVVILWAGSRWYLLGQATIGDITAFQVYVMMLLNPVWQIVESMTELQRSLAAMERVFEVLEMPTDKPDLPDAVPAPSAVSEIRFANVSFAYTDQRYVIRDFELAVRGGQTIALVGRSGAGKTTVTDLVSRFYDPTLGTIYLNGIDLRQIQLASFRDMLGVVQQDVFLFDGTVRENLAYGSRDATLDEIVQAAKQANAHEFIASLPDGYDSLIGERGVKLSGGQRQRLSIARALLANPQILILDEATSNLDTESEQLIQDSMQRLLHGRTTFVIAHRLSTVVHADLIVVMDDGRIVETGTHDQLMERAGTYAEMVLRQNEAVTLL